MSFLVISFVSSTNVIALGSWSSDQEPEFFVWEESTSTDNLEFSSELGTLWEKCEKAFHAGFDLSQIKEIYCLSGPGSFTGIRVGASFAMGLARGLGLPCYSAPTYSLFGESVGIPLRPAHVSKKTKAELLGLEYEFMFQEGDKVIHRKPEPSDQILGTKDSAEEFLHWPTKEQMSRALVLARREKTPFKAKYGVEPKIFGKR